MMNTLYALVEGKSKTKGLQGARRQSMQHSEDFKIYLYISVRVFQQWEGWLPKVMVNSVMDILPVEV